MSNLIKFPDKRDEVAENEANNLISDVSQLLSEWPMESILLALFEVASPEDSVIIFPAVSPILARQGLTNSESEV